MQEDSSFGNQFKLGGLVDIDFSSLSLKPSGLTFGAKFNLGKVGNAGLPDFFFGGSNTLSISQNDAKFGASVKLSLPNFKAEDYEKVNKKLFEFLPLKEFSNISLEYVGSEDKIKIQGKVVIAPFVKLAKQKKNIDFIADFAGDNFIQIQNGKVDVKGSLAVESNIKAANGWGLSELKLDIDTQNKDIGGSAKIVFPFGAKFPPNSAVAAFGLGFKLPIPPLQLNKVSVEFDDLQVPAIIFDGVPVVFFQRLSGSVENFAPSDPDLTEFSGGIGATLGPQIKIGSEKFSLIRLDVDGTISSEQLSATGKVIIINKKNEVRESTATVNWVKRFFELKGNFTFLDGLIKAKASFKTDFKFNITMSGTASAGIPKSVPLVGGSQIASGNFLFNFSNDNNLSNDSITVWNTLDIQKGFEAKFASGVKYYLDGRSEALFKNLPRVGSWAVAANTPWIILSADWENELGTNVPVQIETPDGRLINESEFAANNIAFVDELTNSKTKTVIIFNPSEGIWDIEVPNKTGLGAINYNAVTNSQAPTIAITAPVTDVTGQNATISYNAFDSDSNATVSLFYDNDNQGFDGILIKDGLTETDGAGSFVWNTEGIATGDYYVYAMVLDENNAPAFSYSTGRVSVTEQADLSIATTVNADSVTLGTNLTYTITVTNNGTSNAKGITLTDALPVGVTFVSASITPSEQVDGNLTFDLGNLENGKTTTVSITITPPAVGTLTNTATVTSKTYDPDITNDTTISDSTVTVAKPLSPDLLLTTDASNTPVNLGDQITYTLTVTNNGDGQATGVQLIDDIGSLGVKDVLIKASQGTTSIDSNGNVIAQLGSLNKGEKATVTITATSIVADTLTSTASVTSNEESLNIDNTFLIQNKSVNAINLTSADLELTQTVDNPNPKIGDEVNFTLSLTNKGVGIASGIQIQDILSPDLDFVSALPEQGTYDSQTGIWDVGNMRDNLTTTLKITAKVNKLGAITNTAEVIAVAETDPDSTPNNNNPNEDDQASLTLNTALAIPSLAKIADDIFTISGGSANKPKLQITISDSNLKSVNDLAVFTVDDAQGRINGIAPTETGYTQAALSRAKNIFSAIANLPNGFDPKTLSRSVEFNSGDNLRFLLVKNDTLDNVRKKNVSNPDILFSNASNQKITDSGTGNFILAWKDGSGNSSDFKDFVVNIQATDTSLPLGANLQDQQQGEVLDLSSVDSTKTVQANFVVNREAAYNNFVGFYKITDSQGTITDPLTGLSLKPGETGYTEAAIKNRVAGIDLQAANQSTATINGVFQGGSIFAPFIIANGSVNQLLDADKSNDPSVYFAYLGANSDGVDHIRLLANNTFGFEDLPSGGDFDYNDIIIKANLSVA